MQGQLFTQDLLLRGIRNTPPYQALLTDGAATFAAWRNEVAALFAPLGTASALNEAQTEQQLIQPLLRTLGWGADQLPQVNLSASGREDVPDLLLFANATALAAALAEPQDHRRWRHGVALLEAKRWLRPLDRSDTTPALNALDPGAPSSQMLRYLSRADVVSDRAVKWGLLTNGAVWRLYWQDARSRAEEFFEVDLAQALPVSGVQAEMVLPDAPDAEHLLRLFHLLFSRSAFAPQEWDATGRSFHAYARNEARLYEEAVSKDLGARVFADIFPQLAQALAGVTCKRASSPWATAWPRASSTRATTWKKCAKPRWCCCTACSSCSTRKTATCCPCVTRATTPTACASCAKRCGTRSMPG